MEKKAPKKRVESNPWKDLNKDDIQELMGTNVFEHLRYTRIAVRIEFIEPCLGTSPKDEKAFCMIHEKKGINPEKIQKEMATLDNKDIKNEKDKIGWTGFHRDDKGLFFLNYVMVGNVKANIENLMENGAIRKVVAYKKWTDRLLSVFPRRIRFMDMEKYKTKPDKVLELEEEEQFWLKDAQWFMERPLRGMTAQGERVTIVRSDMVEVGTQFDVSFQLLHNDRGVTPEVLLKALRFGELYGLGQWRGSGKFGAYKVVDVDITHHKRSVDKIA